MRKLRVLCGSKGQFMELLGKHGETQGTLGEARDNSGNFWGSMGKLRKLWGKHGETQDTLGEAWGNSGNFVEA